MSKRTIKHLSLTLGFLSGLWWFGVFRLLTIAKRPPGLPIVTPEFQGRYFASPEAVLAALTHQNVDVRRAVWQQLNLSPGAVAAFYDFARDINYPERADHARLRYVNFDSGATPEALITFVRLDYPCALVLHREPAGWFLAGRFSAWLRYEKYPYDDWLTTPETITPGQHELLLRESAGDANFYTRTLRLWRLEGRAFREIGVFEEESFAPPIPRTIIGPDWKTNCISRLVVAPGQLTLKGSCALVRFSGAAPIYGFRSEIDDAWHTIPGHWRERVQHNRHLTANYQTKYLWNESVGRFVATQRHAGGVQ